MITYGNGLAGSTRRDPQLYRCGTHIAGKSTHCKGGFAMHRLARYKSAHPEVMSTFVTAGSIFRVLTVRVAVLLLILNFTPGFSQGAYAQNPFAGLKDAEKEAKVWMIIEKDVLEVPPTIARLHFSYDRLPQEAGGKLAAKVLEGGFESSELVEAVQVWGEDPSATLAMSNFESIQSRDELEGAELRKYFDNPSCDLSIRLQKTVSTSMLSG